MSEGGLNEIGAGVVKWGLGPLGLQVTENASGLSTRRSFLLLLTTESQGMTGSRDAGYRDLGVVLRTLEVASLLLSTSLSLLPSLISALHEGGFILQPSPLLS